MENRAILDPPEIAEFERLLARPDTDPAGLAGWFNAGRIRVARVPAVLDVMGGSADYSGSNGCAAVLGCGNLIALQPRTDRTLRIRSVQMGARGLSVETRIPLDYFSTPRGLADYREVGAFCRANPLVSWVASIAGPVSTLLREEGVSLSHGFSLLRLGGVPMNAGVGSSAGIGVGTICCLASYLGLGLDASRIARLAQIAENLVVGAPWGPMDPIAVASGVPGCLTHILCRPGSVEGALEIPPGTGFVGINPVLRHSQGGHQYRNVRIGAFMGKRMINSLRQRAGMEPVDHLAEITPEEWESEYALRIPESVRGAEFIEAFKKHDDPVTTIQPGATYRVRGPAKHGIMENDRVLKFMDSLRAANSGDQTALTKAGERMYAAHASYRDECRLSVPEVDHLVEAVRAIGPEKGIYGAKITGGGSGGTVAVFGTLDALEKHIPEIAREYSQMIGAMPDVFSGTSPGAVEFKTVCYSFGSNGWTS